MSAHSNSVDRKKNERLTIGWREYVDVPTWGLRGIKAKADTGARTSAIDVADLVEVGYGRVRFDVVLSRNHRNRRITVETPIVRKTRVRSSLGHAHTRLIVEVPIRIGEIEKVTELGLVCRKNMICRMLLGRSALSGDFVVDPKRCYVLGKQSLRKTKAKTKQVVRKKKKRKVSTS